MPTRSQRHKRELQGVTSGGGGSAMAPSNGGTPTAVGLAAAGSVGRTIVAVSVLNGTPPFTYALTTAAGLSAAFTPNTSNLLKTTADPAGTVGGHGASVTVTDARSRTTVIPVAVTLT